MAQWCVSNNITFTEFPTNGVVRGLKSRDDWKKLRDARITAECVDTPVRMNSPEGLESSSLPSIADFGIESRELLQRPKPGEKAAMEELFSFLDERGRTYRKDMSSPITGWNACSRLSP